MGTSSAKRRILSLGTSESGCGGGSDAAVSTSGPARAFAPIPSAALEPFYIRCGYERRRQVPAAQLSAHPLGAPRLQMCGNGLGGGQLQLLPPRKGSAS